MAGRGGRGRSGGEPGDAGREAREQAQEAAGGRAADFRRRPHDAEGGAPTTDAAPTDAAAGPVEPAAPETIAADVAEAVVPGPVAPTHAVAHEAVEPDRVADEVVAARGTIAGEAVAPTPATEAGGADVAARPIEPTPEDLLGRMVDTGRGVAEDPIGFGARVGDAMVEGGDNFVDATTDRVQDGVQSWAEQASEAAGVDLPDRMSVADLAEFGGEIGARTVDQLGALAERKVDGAVDVAQDGADWAAGTVGGAADRLGAYVEQKADATWDAAKHGADWATGTADDAFEAGSELAGDATDAAADAFDAAADAADALAGTYEDAAGAASQAGEDAAEAVSQAGEDAEDTLTDFLNNFF